MLFYGVVSETTDEAVMLFAERERAKLVIALCNHDEPDRAGELHAEAIELETSVK